MLLALTQTGMCVNRSHRRIVALQYSFDVLLAFRVQVALVDVEILCTYVELVGVSLGEVHAMSVHELSGCFGQLTRT